MDTVTIESLVDRALQRVRSEREHVAAKREAFRTFASRVEDVPTESSGPQGGAAGPTGGEPLSTRTSATSTGDDRCREVREAFAGTVHSHSVEDLDGSESLVETVAAELNDDVAAALAPATATVPFNDVVKRAVLTETNARIRECGVLIAALDGEREALRDANADVDAVIEWLDRATETELTTLGFEGLRARHETLADHRDRCERLARDRQASLDEKTCRGTSLGLTHRSLLSYLYADFPVDFPVLATAVRLDGVCADCQRVVRDHLVRRV